MKALGLKLFLIFVVCGVISTVYFGLYFRNLDIGDYGQDTVEILLPDTVATEQPMITDIVNRAEGLYQTLCDQNIPYIQRSRAALVFKGAQSIPRPEAQSLFDFVRQPTAGIANVDISVKNDTLEVLVESGEFKQELGKYMLTAMNDPKEDLLWREFIVQYVDEFYRTHWSANEEISQDELRDNFKDAIKAMIFDTETSLGGAALLVYDNLSEEYNEFDPALQDRAVKKLSLETDVHRDSRTTALALLEGDLSEDELRSFKEALYADDTSLTHKVTLIAASTRLAQAPKARPDDFVEILQKLETQEVHPILENSRITALDKIYKLTN